ncbi:MAG: hypothetical protein AMK69_26685 [Nitrospira bacterium SG8_3]|nr:MAG: hypothetical protein AMK69_26685 [Nitrospira bacterium SG8_3]
MQGWRVQSLGCHLTDLEIGEQNQHLKYKINLSQSNGFVKGRQIFGLSFFLRLLYFPTNIQILVEVCTLT